MKKVLTAIILFLIPIKFSYWILNLLGHEIHKKSKVGFSIILVNEIYLKEHSYIRHLNLIMVNELKIDEKGYVNRGNVLKGPFNLVLDKRGAIGNSNIITRAPLGVSYGISTLKLGVLSKITANHRIDCMSDITFGDYSTLAGSSSQVWTHGYYHEKNGEGRFRIDGKIEIGNNVYIGSNCVFNPGVKVSDNVIVGSNSSISKNLDKSGLYVSQPLRYVDTNAEMVRERLDKIEGEDLCEEVYAKKI